MELLTEAALPDREQGMPRYRRSVPVGNRPITSMGIAQARLPGGGSINLMRVMQTNACSLSCGYCPTFCGGKVPRATVSPEEVATTFMDVSRKGLAQGLFLTSGVPGRASRATDRMLATLELLRQRERFAGYIHVKLVPGAEEAQIERITALATRVSLNLEAPCGQTLARIAPEKSLPVAVENLERVRSLVLAERTARAYGRPRDPLHPGGVAGMTIQFVVGATPDTDRTLIETVGRLQGQGGIHHAHFSAFRPIKDTPMESVPAAPALREHRLYQADYLLHDYGFTADEMVFEAGGNLPLGLDPKTAWALAHPELFPIELTRADYETLVRVPGIGPVAARRLVAERKDAVLRGLADLRELGVVTTRAAGFLTLRGRRLQTTRWTEQLGFWAPEEEVGRYHLTYEVSPGTFR
jgi:predicted DNA-binding helix-hairpin-helix protein